MMFQSMIRYLDVMEWFACSNDAESYTAGSSYQAQSSQKSQWVGAKQNPSHLEKQNYDKKESKHGVGKHQHTDTLTWHTVYYNMGQPIWVSLIPQRLLGVSATGTNLYLQCMYENNWKTTWEVNPMRRMGETS